MLFSLVVLTTLLGPASAASWDPDLRWRTINTEHFRITFHDGEEQLAVHAAAHAETAWDILTVEIGSTPRVPIDILLVDWTDSPNGSATIIPSNTITIYVTQPSGESTLGLYENWPQAIITHELAHIIHLDTVEGLPLVGRWLLGSLVSVHQVAPLWTIEGFATFEETRHTTGGRGKSAGVDMVKRAAVLDDRFPPLGNMDGFTALPPSGNLRYLFGQDFMQYIADSRGADKWSEWIHRYGASIPFILPAEKTFGDNFVALYWEWKAALIERYTLQAAAVEAEGATPFNVVSREGLSCAAPSWRPDGEWLVYSCSDPRTGSATWRADSQGEKPKIFARGKFADDVSWRADGKAYVYGNLHEDGLYTVVDDVYLFDVDKKSTRQLTDGKRVRDPAFSPDGTRIIAVTNELGRNQLAELTVDQRVLPLTTSTDDTQFNTPRYSPDGSKLAVSVFSAGQRDLWLYSADGKPLRRLTWDSAIDGQPAWSNDGKYLYFTSDRSGIPNVYAIDIAQERLFRVTNAKIGAYSAVPHPSAARMAFLTYTSLGPRVATMVLDPTRWKDLGELPRFSGVEFVLSAPGPARQFVRHAAEPLPVATQAARKVRKEKRDAREERRAEREAKREAEKVARKAAQEERKGARRPASSQDTTGAPAAGTTEQGGAAANEPASSGDVGAESSSAGTTSDGETRGIGTPGDSLPPCPAGADCPTKPGNEPMAMTASQPKEPVVATGGDANFSAAPFDSAELLAAAKPYNPWPTLVPPRFWVPGALFTSTGEDYGLYLSAYTVGVDLLRRWAYSGYATYRTDANFLGGGGSITLNRWRPVFGLSFSTYVSPYSALYEYSPTGKEGGGQIPSVQRGEELYWDHRLRGSIAMSYPTDGLGSFSVSYKGEYRQPKDALPSSAYLPTLPTRGFFSAVTAGWSRGGGDAYALSISPEKARALGAGIEYTPSWLGSWTYDEENQPIAFDQVQLTGEWREYRPAPWAANHVFALKLSGGFSLGSTFRYGSFRLGGSFSENGITVIPQEWRSLRGYYTSTRSGETFWLASGEYRFPIWYVERGVGTIPLFVRHVSGALVVDSGNAWEDPDDAGFENSLVGLGAELRASAIAFYGLPLYGRVGYAFGLANGGIEIGSLDGLYFQAGTSF